MQKTFVAKKKEIKRTWYLVDAKDKILGRLATRVASVLKGKHKAIYTPHLDTGDGVIILNASGVKVTGRKAKQKIYRRYSGYPGGLKEIPYQEMFQKKPVTVVKLAIKRMLPTGPLGRDMLKKLKIYADNQHPHKGQTPVSLEV